MPKARERRCIVTRQVCSEAELIRFVAGPDGCLVPDIAARLPGRGAWVKADRDTLAQAIKRKAFARALEAEVSIITDLADLTESLLERSALNALGLGRKSGDLAAGYDQARAAIAKRFPAWIVEASDGAADGRAKVLAKARSVWDEAPPVCGCFPAHVLGQALGRDAVIHIALFASPAAKRFSAEVRRLAGFRPLVPPDWRV